MLLTNVQFNCKKFFTRQALLQSKNNTKSVLIFDYATSNLLENYLKTMRLIIFILEGKNLR